MVTCDVDRDVSTVYSAGLLQAMRSTGYATPYKARCSAVIGCFIKAVIGALRSSRFRWVVPSPFRLVFPNVEITVFCL